MSTIETYAPPHPAIAHLSIEQIKELHSRYLAGEKVNTLFTEYNIETASNHLQPLLPLRTLLTLPCPGCGQPLQQKWQTKTNGEPEPFCKPCNHIQSSSCGCTSCHATRIRKYNGKWASTVVRYDLLSLREKILLLALIWSTDHARASINRFQGAGAFCTSPDGSSRYIEQLRKNGVIKLVYAENWLADIKSTVSYGLEKTAWRSNVSDGEHDASDLLSPEDLISRLKLDLDENINEADEETIVTLIREVSEDDAFQYAEEQLTKQNLEMTAEAKTRETLRTLLETTALESVCAAAWEAAKSVGEALKTKAATNRRHASNMFPSTLKKRANSRASNSDAWRVQRSHLHVSRISRVLHDRIFGGEDAFFTWPLSRYYSEVVIPRLVLGKVSTAINKPYALPAADER